MIQLQACLSLFVLLVTPLSQLLLKVVHQLPFVFLHEQLLKVVDNL